MIGCHKGSERSKAKKVMSFLKGIMVAMERAEEIWKLLLEYKDYFLTFIYDMKRFYDGVNTYYLVDTCEPFSYMFYGQEWPVSKITESIIDKIMDDEYNNRVFLPPNVAQELLYTLLIQAKRFPSLVQELKSMFDLKEFERHPEKILSIKVNRDIALKTKAILIIRDLRYKYPKHAPLKRLRQFLLKYEPLSLDELKDRLSLKDLENEMVVKKDEIRARGKLKSLFDVCLKNIEKVRSPERWHAGPQIAQRLNECDAFSAALALYLNDYAGKDKVYFPIYTKSRVFSNIKWRGDNIRPGWIIYRDYEPMALLMSALDIYYKEMDQMDFIVPILYDKIRKALEKETCEPGFEHGFWTIRLALPSTAEILRGGCPEGIIKEIREILKEKGDITMGDIKSILKRWKEEVGEIEYVEPDIQEALRKCIIFLNAIDDLVEVEEQAMEAIESIYKELLKYLPENLRGLTIEDLIRRVERHYDFRR